MLLFSLHAREQHVIITSHETGPGMHSIGESAIRTTKLGRLMHDMKIQPCHACLRSRGKEARDDQGAKNVVGRGRAAIRAPYACALLLRDLTSSTCLFRRSFFSLIKQKKKKKNEARVFSLRRPLHLNPATGQTRLIMPHPPHG